MVEIVFTFSLLFEGQSEVTEFFADLAEFSAKLSEVSLPKQQLSKQYSTRFLMQHCKWIGQREGLKNSRRTSQEHRNLAKVTWGK